MKPVVSEKCRECKHYMAFRRGLKVPICKAFPDGIPFEISRGWNDHTKSYSGDHGIQFEPSIELREAEQ